MRTPILTFLASKENATLKQSDMHSLNTYLQSNFPGQPPSFIRSTLIQMRTDKVADISGDIGLLGATIGGVVQTYDHLTIHARIKPAGLREIGA